MKKKVLNEWWSFMMKNHYPHLVILALVFIGVITAIRNEIYETFGLIIAYSIPVAMILIITLYGIKFYKKIKKKYE